MFPMTIRPIDLQGIVPKTTQVAKTNQALKDNSEALQNLLSTQYKNQLQMAKQKVVTRENPEGVTIDTKNHKKDPNERKRKRGQKRQNEPKTPSRKKSRRDHHGTYIDVKV